MNRDGTPSGASEHLGVNREQWDQDADNWVEGGERRWQLPEPVWGIWDTPNRELPLLPEDMTGMDAIELGCGTGYVSAWMARRGASVVGIDISSRQLATARRLAAEHEIELELIEGNAETVPCTDGAFDFAISEYGAVLWCDPHVWVKEAYRLLRSGGEMVLLSNHSFVMLFSPLDGSLPLTESLERDYFSIYRSDWRDAVDDPGGIEFHLPISGWFHLFRETGFEVLDFDEIQSSHGGTETNFFVTADWARKYPTEQVWRLRKPAVPTST